MCYFMARNEFCFTPSQCAAACFASLMSWKCPVSCHQWGLCLGGDSCATGPPNGALHNTARCAVLVRKWLLMRFFLSLQWGIRKVFPSCDVSYDSVWYCVSMCASTVTRWLLTAWQGFLNTWSSKEPSKLTCTRCLNTHLLCGPSHRRSPDL